MDKGMSAASFSFGSQAGNVLKVGHETLRLHVSGMRWQFISSETAKQVLEQVRAV